MDLDPLNGNSIGCAFPHQREARVSGRYFHHRKEASHHASADDATLQDELIAACERLTGVALPSQARVL